MIEARVIFRICDRFGCLPSAARAEDASVLRLLEIEDRMGWRQPAQEYPQF